MLIVYQLLMISNKVDNSLQCRWCRHVSCFSVGFVFLVRTCCVLCTKPCYLYIHIKRGCVSPKHRGTKVYLGILDNKQIVRFILTNIVNTFFSHGVWLVAMLLPGCRATLSEPSLSLLVIITVYTKQHSFLTS